MVKSRQVVLNSRPTGTPTADNFKVVSVDISEELKDGEVLVKNLWMSVDPYMRGRMNDTKSYIPAFQINQPLSGGAIGEVIKSNNSVPVGAFVSNFNGWQEHFVASGKTVQVIEAKREELADYLGVLGMPGLTAWGGFTQLYFGKPSAGKTVFVSAASGAVGLLVCQLAKLNGNTVIGTAGSQDKIDFLKSVGVDHVINYKESKDLTASLAAVAPNGIDFYFDNVGYEHLEAFLNVANRGAGIAMCGMIAGYNESGKPGPKNLGIMIGKGLVAQGFLVLQFEPKRAEFLAEVAPLVRSGKIKYELSVLNGIDKAAEGMIGLFSGANKGKMLIKLAE